MSVIKPSLPKGTRDFLPEQMIQRQFVMRTMQDIFEKYGYQPLETPSIEKLEVLSGKYGDEGEKLIFKVLRRGTGLEDLLRGKSEFMVRKYGDLVEEALRYDLTVPLSRVVAMYQNDLVLPFKRYQIQPVWRADRPQRGRYREFYQCDVDTVGTDSMLADAETIAIVHEVLSTLGFERFTIRLNNRKILDGLLEYAGIRRELTSSALISIDKIDKIGVDGVRKDMQARGLSGGEVSKLLNVLEIAGDADTVLAHLLDFYGENAALREGAEELQEILAHLGAMGVPQERCKVDLFLVRGLGYYTGTIHESVVEEPKIGSLTGGGRYDRLIGMFLGRDIPATGTAFGVERIIDVMAQLNMFPPQKSKTHVLIASFDKTTQASTLKMAQDFRRAGLNAEVYLNTVKLKKQFSYADRKQIPFVAIIGPDEQANNTVTLKDLGSGQQETLQRDAAVAQMKKILDFEK